MMQSKVTLNNCGQPNDTLNVGNMHSHHHFTKHTLYHVYSKHHHGNKE